MRVNKNDTGFILTDKVYTAFAGNAAAVDLDGTTDPFIRVWYPDGTTKDLTGVLDSDNETVSHEVVDSAVVSMRGFYEYAAGATISGNERVSVLRQSFEAR